jgi:ABC-type Mn2+/Zn2+ transport system ATPase subunit
VDSGRANVKPCVSLNAATRRFGKHQVLGGVDFSIQAGEAVGVVGVNGSGKSTLLRVLANVLSLHDGTRTGPKRAAYLPAKVEPPPMSPRRWITVWQRMEGRSFNDVQNTLERLSFDGSLDLPCSSLSTGNFRKVLLTATVCTSSELIVLDEPSAALDTAGRQGLTGILCERIKNGASIVIAEHDVAWLETVTQRSIEIRAGRTHEIAKMGESIRLVLEGPIDRRNELAVLASQLGFRETKE